MGNMKTPGVYILEKNAFPNSVVEVATAVPAFIGYTEKAENKGNTLRNVPWRITSMAEFHQYFGGAPTEEHVRFKLTAVAEAAPAATPPPADSAAAAPAAPAPATAATPPAEPAPAAPLGARDATPLSVNRKGFLIQQNRGLYLLYYSMRLFFMNGGGPCYIVSVGDYSKAEGIQIDAGALAAGMEELTKEQEPTMVVVPEAVLLKKKDCDSLQMAALLHCGYTMKNRFAILDIWEGYQPRSNMPDVVAAFRDKVGINQLAYGAAYYPWVNTTVVQERELSYANLDSGSRQTLIDCIKAELLALGVEGKKLAAQNAEVDKINTATDASEVALLAKSLTTISPFFNAIITEIAKRLNLLPPSGAMAGIYTMVDNARGVWKAPANVSLNSVVSPAVPISHEQQEDLNVTPQGKSINAIRSFIGEGTLVWGARTLDGNSLDWRYINVRRTMIMLEESVRLAAKAMVFEPNVANTWVTMKGMISNFLTGIWKRGGLAGAVPEDAFSVHVGLGETMTPEDILEGILRVTVLVAISRPAEFIEITFQQQMQKS
ncbi:MAG: phage tail sheath C-terminal domain-containing protein [Rubrivivax sp.]|nr:phage tail sheath C-terminal domain-containing protein [Rubrivivax sp.]